MRKRRIRAATSRCAREDGARVHAQRHTRPPDAAGAISLASLTDLGCTSAAPRLHLGCTSAAPRLHLAVGWASALAASGRRTSRPRPQVQTFRVRRDLTRPSSRRSAGRCQTAAGHRRRATARRGPRRRVLSALCAAQRAARVLRPVRARQGRRRGRGYLRGTARRSLFMKASRYRLHSAVCARLLGGVAAASARPGRYICCAPETTRHR